MAFQKKTETVADKLRAINTQLNLLEEEIAQKEKDLLAKKDETAKALGNWALNSNAENQDTLRKARASLSRIDEALTDLKDKQILLVHEKKKIQTEFLEARLRDVPAEMEKAADQFNQVLTEAIKAAQGLKGFHETLLAKQSTFLSLSHEFEDARKKLNRVVGYELKTQLGLRKNQNLFIPTVFAPLAETLLTHEQQAGQDDPNEEQREKVREQMEKQRQEQFEKEGRPWSFLPGKKIGSVPMS